MKVFDRKTLAAAVCMALPVSASAQLGFDTGFGSIPNFDQIDFAASNVLSVNGNQAFVNFINTGGLGGGTCTSGAVGDPCGFDVIVQGRVADFRLNNAGVADNFGLGSNYELTYVAKFSEFVSTAVAGGANVAVFDFVDDLLRDGTPNAFNIFYDTNVNSDDLAGTGFTDGDLIFSNNIRENPGHTSTFTTTGATGDIGGNVGATPDPAWRDVPGAPVGLFQSVIGAGATTALDLLSTPPDVYDTDRFKGILDTFQWSSIDQTLAYDQVDPALLFDETSASNPGGLNLLSQDGRLGAFNGGVTQPGGAGTPLVASGPDIIFQTDNTSSLTGHQQVPAPASIALLGLGLAGVGLARRRKAAKKS